MAVYVSLSPEQKLGAKWLYFLVIMMCIGDISQQTMHMHLKACWVLIVLFIRISNNNLIFNSISNNLVISICCVCVVVSSLNLTP